MNTVVCVNTGTTNTSVSVWSGGGLLHVTHHEAGVRDTAITGSKDTLIAGIRTALYEALDACKIDARSIKFIMATGMISSEIGIFEVPHTDLPVDINALSQRVIWKTIPEIIECPIAFVPGVKYKDENGDCVDFMRGEEIETFALLDRLHINDPCIVLLPGSHCKCIYVDAQGRIVKSDTMLSGELIDAITNHTILAGATQRSFADSIEAEYLLLGADASKRFGVTKACFQIRIMEKDGKYSRISLANFLLGAVLYYDLLVIKNLMDAQNIKDVYIAGNQNVSEAYMVLLKKYYDCNAISASPQQTYCLSAYGAMMVAKRKGLID